ncbi:MAG TPA: winged helix-turn-helix domain-containing protein [Chloroflexota bacterium]|nr:winged helix-turn-helix domain-containing protein [Chloroflexota bacterium]
MALSIRADWSAGELRGLARREKNGRIASRLLAIANALDGMSRRDAARAAGMDRQTLRALRQAQESAPLQRGRPPTGLRDRPKGHAPQALSEGEQAALANIIFRGPDPERDGISAWTLADLCGWLEQRFGKRLHPASLSRILRRNGFSRQKARPVHPRRDAKAQEGFQKRGSAMP